MVMKKYDKLFAYVLVCIAAACFGILFGCRSTKGAVEETTIQEVSESSADSTFNAAATAEKTKETRADSSNVRADERGRVEIERDSAGSVRRLSSGTMTGVYRVQTPCRRKRANGFMGLTLRVIPKPPARLTQTPRKRKKQRLRWAVYPFRNAYRNGTSRIYGALCHLCNYS